MKLTIWSDEEDLALQGLPLAAQLLYLRGLRTHMDRCTGLVGAKHGISWQMLMEVLYVEPHRGMVGTGTPDKSAVRRLMPWLEKAGLVISRGGADALVFFLPLAVLDKCVQKKADTKPTQSRHGQADIVDNASFPNEYNNDGYVGYDQADTKPTQSRHSQADIHQISNIKETEVLTSSSSKVVSTGAVDNSLLLPGGKPVSRPVQIAVLVRKWEAEHSRIAALTGSHPKVIAWAEAGVTDDQLADAYSAAVADRNAKGDSRPISAGFLDVFVSRVLNPPVVAQGGVVGSAGGRQGPWHQSWQGIVTKAAELGLQQGKEELAPHFKLRVFRAAGVTEQELRVAAVDAGRR